MNPYYETKLGKLYLGDCLTVTEAIPDDSIDLVIIDPPYSKEYNWVWPWLARESERVLKTNAHLITLLGQFFAHVIINEPG